MVTKNILFKNYKIVKTQIRGRGTYSLWVADTEEKKRIGLSRVKKLLPRTGMIFVYNSDVENNFTMKETSIPLTIIFLDKDMNIIDAFKCKPFQSGPVNPGKPYRYVIEI